MITLSKLLLPFYCAIYMTLVGLPMPCKCPPASPHIYTILFSAFFFWQPCYPILVGNAASGPVKLGTLFEDKLFYYIDWHAKTPQN
jgi:hypothetical protein